MSIQKSLQNARLAGSVLSDFATNVPSRYAQRQKQYFSSETQTFTQMYAKYSSDYVSAEVQGLDEAAPYEWQTRMLRFADVVRPTAAIQRDFDDYKMILFADRDIEYVVPGSKIITMGSTWLAVNPINISGADGMSVARRCNSVWNHLDYYGNVVSEPIVVENFRANASDSDAQQGMYITKGYFNVTCQYNSETAQINTNTRMILGSGAYRVTGFTDFEQEFTGDYGAVRLLRFAVRYEEPNDVIDDRENHVAGGKAFSWDVNVIGPSTLRAGTSGQFTATSSRNNETVTSTDENPISYVWTSSDESVATVDGDGNVTAIEAGTAVITATLAQNATKAASVAVEVTEAENGVEFTTTLPATLSYGESVVISAAYFEGGERTEEALEWSFAGADERTYTASETGQSVTITCYGYSATPLTVTAAYGGYSVSADIRLEGI